MRHLLERFTFWLATVLTEWSISLAPKDDKPEPTARDLVAQLLDYKLAESQRAGSGVVALDDEASLAHELRENWRVANIYYRAHRQMRAPVSLDEGSC